MIRVLIADDHDLMRDGLKQLLGNSGDMTVVGEACNGRQVLDILCRGKCDVLLLDMAMPGRTGIDLIKQIKADYPRLHILVFSMHKEDIYTVRTIQAGAAGYICKGSPSKTLLDAIRQVAGGRHYISPEVAGDLVFGLITNNKQLPHTLLSDREFEVFNLLVEGAGIAEISRRLSLSPKTVSTYKARILEKLQLSNVPDLIHYGFRHNLLDGVANHCS